MAQVHVVEAVDSLASLERIPGLDVAYGLAQAHHNVEMYMRLMNVFVRVHGQDAVRLAQALRADDLVSVKKVAHALKGSAAMIGVKGVADAAAALHAACEVALAPDELFRRCESIDTALASFVESFRRLPVEQNAV